MINISIVIPFFNENKNLEYLIKEWSNYLKKNLNIKNNFYFKLYFFNDGSTDNSVDIINSSEKLFDYEIINKKNSGHGDTCIYSYKYIISLNKFDYILQIDSDNQCDPKYLNQFLKKIPKSKFIFGNRVKREDGFIRIVATKLLSISVLIISRKYIPDLNVPYRIMKCNDLIPYLSRIPKDVELKNAYLTFLIINKNRINWINLTFRKRLSGSSFFKLNKMFKFFINLLKHIYHNK